MVSIRYRILFTINVLHEYYDDKLSKDTVLIPTKASMQILKNHQMIFKSTANGGIVLVKITDDDGTLQIPILNTQNFRLSFYLNPTSPYFYNRTSLKLNPDKITTLTPNRRGFYFSNLEKSNDNIFKVAGFNINEIEEDLKHLSKIKDKEVDVEDEVIYMPSIFRVKFNVPTNSFKINIKNRADADVVPITTLTTDENFNEYEIKLAKDLAPDLYKVILNEGTPQNVYISDQVFHDSPFGIIEIFHSSGLGNFDFLKSTGVDPNIKIQIKGEADYFIWFKNRKLKWKYVFPKEIPNNIDINFAGGSDKVGHAIISKNEFGITNNYTKIQITEGVSVKNNLPNPDGTVIKLNPSDPSAYVAEVFV